MYVVSIASLDVVVPQMSIHAPLQVGALQKLRGAPWCSGKWEHMHEGVAHVYLQVIASN